MCQAFDEDFIYICLGDFVLSCSVVSDSLQPHELYSLPGSSVHGDSPRKNTEMCYQALLQETSQPRDQTKVPCIAGRFFTVWATREAVGDFRNIYYHTKL